MRTIYKYPLAIAPFQTLKVPKEFQILSVQFQAGTLCLWALVDNISIVADRTIEIYGTGHRVPSFSLTAPHYGTDGSGPRSFLGTVQAENGLVWHVFLRL